MFKTSIPITHAGAISYKSYQSETNNSITSDIYQANAGIQTGGWKETGLRATQGRFHPRPTSRMYQTLESYRRSRKSISSPFSKTPSSHSDFPTNDMPSKAIDPIRASECPANKKLPNGCERVIYVTGEGSEFLIAVKPYPGDLQLRRVAVDMKTGEPLEPPCILKMTPTSCGFVYMRAEHAGLMGGSPSNSTATYGDVTDPAKHDSEREWRYLVNGIPNHQYNISTLPSSKNRDLCEKRRMVLENPAMMGEEFNPSTSLIDPRHTHTAWPNGYIVRAPQSLIAATGYVDLGAPPLATSSEIEKWINDRNLSIKPAEDVLLNTPANMYNEVFIHRNRGDGETREATIVEATFSKINKIDGAPFEESTALLMEDIGRKFNLPHVKIECYSRFTPDKIIRASGGSMKGKILSVDISDKRYFLGNFSWARDQGSQLKTFPMTNQDFDLLLSFLEKNGVPELELNGIKEKYNNFTVQSQTNMTN